MTSSSWVLDQLEVGSSVGPSCDLMGLILGLPSWMIGGSITMSGNNHIIRFLIINIEVDMVCTFTSIYYIYIVLYHIHTNLKLALVFSQLH